MVVQVDSELREITELANVLWREREVMTLVLFKLTEERLVVAAGQTRWLADANRELEGALEQLRAIEVLRAVESHSLSDRLALPADSTLAALAEHVAEPWSTIMLEHRAALLELAGEIAEAVELNRRLLDAGAKLVRETLHSITASAGTYDAHGVTDITRGRPARLDEQA